MQYRKFGRTGLTVSRLCLGTMTFGLQTERGRVPSHSRHGRGCRRELHRHGQCVSARRRRDDCRPHGGDRRALAEGQARALHSRDEGGRQDGTVGVGPRRVAQASAGCDRRLVASGSARITSTSTSSIRRREYAARRNARGAGRDRAIRQGALYRRVELSRLPAGARAWAARMRCARRASSPCSLVTTCCSARSSANCCRSRPRSNWP